MANRKGTIVTPAHDLHHQKGIAALLLVLLTGLSATVVALGTMSYVRGSQKSQMTVHAQTQSEVNAWAGVQALSTYMNNSLTADPNTTFNNLGNLTFSRTDNGITRAVATASQSSTCPSATSNDTFTCFDVTGTSANSNVSLRVAFRINQPSAIPVPQIPNQNIVFNGNVNVNGGGLDVIGYENDEISVNGDLTLGNAATSRISGCATGDINVNGGGIADNGHLYSSGGDITYNGQKASGAELWGQNVTVKGGGGSYKSINAVETITITSANIETINKMHANNIDVNGGAFTSVTVANDFTLGNAGVSEFGNFEGGGDIYIVDDWAAPSFRTSSKIGGRVRLNKEHQHYPPHGKSIKNLQENQLDVNPDQPKSADCATEVEPFNVNKLINQANYIFYFHDAEEDDRDHSRSARDEEDEENQPGDPMLKIQNVKDKNGNTIDRVINLKDHDLKAINKLEFMLCNWRKDDAPSCLDPNAWNGPSIENGWNLSRVIKMPPGIVLFGGKGDPVQGNLEAVKATLSIDGIGPESLYTTVLSTGDLYLANYGNKKSLTALYFTDASEVCDGNFYPTNLCDKASGDSQFSDRNEEKLYVGNNAIMANGKLTSGGWTIHGHVILGDGISNHANETTIYGGLLVGLNAEENNDEDGNTLVNAGGLTVDISDLNTEQLFTYLGGASTGSSGTAGTNSGSTVTLRTVQDFQVSPL